MTIVGVTYQTIIILCCRVANYAMLLMTFGMTLAFYYAHNGINFTTLSFSVQIIHFSQTIH